MPGDGEERNRVLGVNRGSGRSFRTGNEAQRVLGFPVEWFSGIDGDWLASLAHPVRRYRHWMMIRRLGPYAPNEGDPEYEETLRAAGSLLRRRR